MLSCSQLWEQAVSNQCCICWILKIRLDMPSLVFFFILSTDHHKAVLVCLFFSSSPLSLQEAPGILPSMSSFILQILPSWQRTSPGELPGNPTATFSWIWNGKVSYLCVFPSFSTEIRCLHHFEGVWFAFSGCGGAPVSFITLSCACLYRKVNSYLNSRFSGHSVLYSLCRVEVIMNPPILHAVYLGNE